MEPRGSLPHSQEPAICPYPEPQKLCCPIYNKPIETIRASGVFQYHVLLKDHLPNINPVYQIKENEMGGTCGTYEGELHGVFR
jgi:hypothetical protein